MRTINTLVVHCSGYACRYSETALGSDLMTNGLEGYAFLKIAGKGDGLEALGQMLSARFNRTPAKRAEPRPDAPKEQGADTKRPRYKRGLSVLYVARAFQPLALGGNAMLRRYAMRQSARC